jgi:hypothetical protein
MNKIKLASGVILVFLVGVLAGSLGTGIYYKKRVEKFEAGGPPIQERIQIILGRFSNDLDLTREQKTEFEKIVKESQEKKVSLGEKIFPEIKEINEQTFKSIRDKLNAGQKTKLDSLIKRMNEVHNKFPSEQSRPQRSPEPSPQGGTPGPNLPQGTPQRDSGNWAPDQAIPKGAPEESPSERRSRRFVGELKDQLNLTPVQEEKVMSAMETFAKEQKKVLEQYKQEKQDYSALKSALLKTESSLEKDLSNLLNKEQLEKYKKAKESGALKAPKADAPLN